jgi:hypothetical protein
MNSVIAAIVGGTCGALAGVWSVYRLPAVGPPVAQAPTTTAVVASSPSPPRVTAAEDVHEARAEPPAATTAVRAAARPAPARTPSVAAPDVAAAGDVLGRARALAHRPDVTALIALRENFALSAAKRGEKDSAATKQQLEELDRYLAEARELRLKIDALEFRKSASEPAPHK